MRSLSALGAGAIFAFVAVPASGQAWTPPARNGSVSIIAQTLHADAHTEGDGRYAHNIDLRSHSLTASIDYGLTDRLAVSISLPYITARYRGPIPHAGSIVDDGNYHGAVPDLDVECRYKIVDGAFVVTPFVGGQWPTRDYSTLGHASAGRGLTEYSTGVDIGHEATWLSPWLFVSAGYSYSRVERAHDEINVDRSNLDVRLTWYVTPRLALHAANSWQHTYGGLDIPLSAEERQHHAHHHDQMLRADHWRVSTGVTWSLRPNVDVILAWALSLESQNSHSFRTLSLGAGWTFDASQLRPWHRVAAVP